MILAALVLSLPAQLPDVKLNYTTVAVPLSRICEELSKQAGVRLRVTDDLAAEPVVIRFVDVPAKEGLDKIASTIRAEWVTSQEGMLLTRTQRLQQKLEEEEFKTKVEDIRISQQRAISRSSGQFGEKEASQLAAEFAVMSNLDPERRRNPDHGLAFRNLDLRTPLKRFLARLYVSLDPEFLAQLPDEDRVVLSTRPTPMQRRLPLPDGLLESLVREQDLFATAVAKTNYNKALYPGTVPATLPNELQVIAVAQGGSLDLRILDPAYTILAADGLSFGWDSAWDAREAERQIPKDEPMKFSPLLEELVGRTQMTMGDMNPRGELSAQAQEVLLNPEQHDPLVAFSELFIRVAERDGVSTVAYAPDTLAQSVLGFMFREPVTPAKMFMWINRDRRAQVDRSAEWLVCSARKPLAILQTRLPRAALGRYVRQLHREGYVSVANAGEFILPFADERVRELGWFYTTMIRGKQGSTPLDHPDLIRFYSALTPNETHAFETQGKITFGELSSHNAALIERFVYRGDLQTTKPMYSSEDWSRWSQSMRHEPTIALPNGLPKEAEVAFTVSDREVFVMTSKMGADDPPHDRSTGIQGIASFYAQSQRTDLFPFAANFEIISLVPSRVLRLELKVNLPQDYLVRSSFEEQRPTGEQITFQQFLARMSEEEQQEWQRMIARANENFKKVPREEIPPQTVPPPPPLSR